MLSMQLIFRVFSTRPMVNVKPMSHTSCSVSVDVAVADDVRGVRDVASGT